MREAPAAAAGAPTSTAGCERRSVTQHKLEYQQGSWQAGPTPQRCREQKPLGALRMQQLGRAGLQECNSGRDGGVGGMGINCCGSRVPSSAIQSMQMSSQADWQRGTPGWR